MTIKMNLLRIKINVIKKRGRIVKIKSLNILIFLITSLILVFGGCSGSSSPSSSRSSASFDCFEYNNDKTQITGYREKDSYGENCSTDVTLPEGITSIENEAFENKGLTSVTFSEVLVSIGASAFKDNQIESLDIPDTVADIGASAFVGNAFSTQVYIPNEGATVDATAFDSSVRVVHEGTESCFEITSNALSNYYCESPSVVIPSQVTAIENEAFEDKGLTSVTFSEVLVSIGASAFKDNQIESLDIPNTVADIGASAFAGNAFSTSIYIPNEGATVDATAFDSSVRVVHEGTESCFEITSNALSNYYCESPSVVIPSQVTAIENEAFENKGLTSVTFSEVLVSIGVSAFEDNQIESLDIPDTVTNIGASAFVGNAFSTHVYIPNEGATVDATAFDSSVRVVHEGTESCFEITSNALSNYYCESPSVVIPAQVTAIEDEAFENKGLTSVTFSEVLVSIGASAFEGNQIESLDIPDTVTNIGASAFVGNAFSTQVYIPNEGATVDATAFDLECQGGP